MKWFYLPVIVIGLLSLLAGVFNWKWWMDNPRARSLTLLFGGHKARLFDMAFGAAMILVGFIGLLF